MLIVCNHCRRHVRHSDSKCPFCGTSVSSSLSRYGVGLAVALTVATSLGCSDDGGSPVPVYSAPPAGGTTAQGGSGNPRGAATQGGTSQTTTNGIGGGMIALYMGPPVGGNSATPSTGSGGGGAVTLYGAPPAPPGAGKA